MSRINIYPLHLLVVLIAGLSMGISTYFILNTNPVNAAADVSRWKPGQIIDDSIFYNSSDMTVEQVQAFLNKQVPVCDTAGLKPSSYGGGTRAQYGASRGYPAPYTCLRDYFENTSTRESNLAGNPAPVGAISAAQIIKNAADANNISVRALLVIIQKESPGPLITDDWPFPNQYRNAMGYGCPDTAPCDPAFEGFNNQVSNAAKQFVKYKNNPNSYRHKAGQSNAVLYNPNASCGSGSVYIDTKATAGLYNYTPYQPNQAALNNLYGSGDGCSAYGNRNFWRMFNDWFGSTVALECTNSEPTMPQVVSLYNPTTYQHFFTPYSCEANILSQKQGFLNEGAVFNTTDPVAVPSAVPVYRLYNAGTFQHLWTISMDEVESAQRLSGYRLEGVAFYVAPSNAAGAHPVYRVYNHKTYQHIWTSNLYVVNYLEQVSDFRNEGAAFFSQ